MIPLDGIPEAEKDFGLGEGRHDVLVEVGHRVIHAASKTISGLKLKIKRRIFLNYSMF